MIVSQHIKDILKSALKKEFSKFSNINFDLTRSYEENFGDYSTNIAMILAKQTNQNPKQIAEVLIKVLIADKIFQKIEIAGPGFINFYLADNFIFQQIKNILNNKFVDLNIGRGKTILIDYSSPNIAKPFGVGHLRSTVIGAAVYNLYSYLGYKTIGDNHLGDWGTQFGKMIYAIQNWGNEQKIKKDPIGELQKLYVKFHDEAKSAPNLEKEARIWFKKLEDGDKTAKIIWQKCVNWSLKEFDKIYQTLNVHFDFMLGESFYQDKMDAIIEKCKKQGIAKTSNNALVIFVPNVAIPAMLVKSDGATTYLARDLATIKYRLDKFSPEKIIYHVGNEQSLHFQQLFGVARLLGWDKHCEFIHANHGLIRTKQGKLSTRSGQTISLKDLIILAEKNAKSIVNKKDKNTINKELIKEIAVGAIKYSDLSSNRKTDIIFDWQKMFALFGNSGPYLQYVYARTKSVLKKAGKWHSPDKLYISERLERNILVQIIGFNEIILRAAQEEMPNILTEYLYTLASNFNLFYDKLPILKSDEKSRQTRLLIVDLTSQIIKKGLNILGIEAPDKM